MAYTWEQFDAMVEAAFKKHDPFSGVGGMLPDSPLSDEQIVAELTEAMTAAGVPLPDDRSTLIGCFLKPEAHEYFRKHKMHDWRLWVILAHARRQAKFENDSLPLTRRQIEIGAGPQMC